MASVAGGVHVALLAAACVLLVWSDGQLPQRCVTGLRSTGKLEWTGVLRKVITSTIIAKKELLAIFDENLVKLKKMRGGRRR